MSPRKGHAGHVPRWLYKSGGQRRKSIVEGPYNCPTCGKRGLTIRINRDNKAAEARCSCGFSRDLEFRPIFQPVDYYGKLIDHYYQ